MAETPRGIELAFGAGHGEAGDPSLMEEGAVPGHARLRHEIGVDIVILSYAFGESRLVEVPVDYRDYAYGQPPTST